MAKKKLILKVDWKGQAATKGVDKLRRKVGGLGKSAKNASRSFAGLSSTFGKIARFALPAVGIGALTLGVSSAVKSFAEFDKAMRQVNTVAGLSRREFLSLKDSIGNIALETATAKVEVAAAAYEVFSRITKDTNAVLFNTRIAAQAAKAGMTDARQAALLLAGQMNAFGITAQESFDGLFKAVDLGGITFAGMASSLGRLSPIAAKVNVSFDEMLSALAFVTKQGVQEDIAVTSLRAALNAVLQPSEKVRKVSESLGIDMSFAGLQAAGLTGIIDKLNKIFIKDKKAVIDLFPNIRSLVAVLALAGDETGGFNKIMGEMGKKAGAGTAAFDEMATGIEAAMKRIGIAFDNFSEATVSLVEPEIEKTLGFFTNIFDFWGKQLRKQESATRKFGRGTGRVVGAIASLGLSEVFRPTFGVKEKKLISAEDRARRAGQKRLVEEARRFEAERPGLKIFGLGGLGQPINIRIDQAFLGSRGDLDSLGAGD